MKLDILEVRYLGKLGCKELTEFGESLSRNKMIPRELKILTDVREGEYDFSERELPVVLDALKIQLKAFTFIKAAFVQTRPKETAMSMITEQRNTIPNYYHKVFSTPDAAMKWLLEKNV